MIAQRRCRIIDCVVILTCGKTTRIATSVSAVVVPSRSPIIVDVRRGRSTSVATIVATARRGGSKGKSSRRVDGVAGSRVLPSVRKQAHVAADVLRDVLESTRIGLGTASATRGIADVDHAWCRCGDRGGWCRHVFGSHIGSRGIGIDVVGRDNSRGELGTEITVDHERRRVVFVVAVVHEGAIAGVAEEERTAAAARHTPRRWWRRRRPAPFALRWRRRPRLRFTIARPVGFVRHPVGKAHPFSTRRGRPRGRLRVVVVVEAVVD